MAAKSEFDIGSFVGQHFGTRGSRMITKFIVDQDGFLYLRAATQNIPDTVTMLMAGKPFEVGNTARRDHDDIRLQRCHGVVIGMDRASYIDIQETDFFGEPVCHPANFAAPTGRCRQRNLSTEAIKRLEKSNVVTA